MQCDRNASNNLLMLEKGTFQSALWTFLAHIWKGPKTGQAGNMPVQLSILSTFWVCGLHAEPCDNKNTSTDYSIWGKNREETSVLKENFTIWIKKIYISCCVSLIWRWQLAHKDFTLPPWGELQSCSNRATFIFLFQTEYWNYIFKHRCLFATQQVGLFGCLWAYV